MQDKKIIQSYINNFRRHLSKYLKPGIGLLCKVFPARSEGAIFELSLGSEIENDDHYMPTEESVNDVLKKIDQKMVSGNIDAIWFAGTNISMEPNRIIMVKGEDKTAEWSDKTARKDVERIVAPLPERNK